MDLKAGDKVVINLGKFRGSTNKIGTWNLPVDMLHDGTIATIKDSWRGHVTLEECINGYGYPHQILLIAQSKKQKLLKIIKDIK